MNYKMPCVVESVKLYFRIGFSWKEMILLLGHCIIVCVSTHCDDKYKDVDGCWWSGGQKEKKHINLKELVGFGQMNGQMKQYWWLHTCAIKRMYVAS